MGDKMKLDKIMVEKFKCAICEGIFEKITPEEEAIAELHEYFGSDMSIEKCALVCDDCWQKIRPDRN